MTSPTPPAQASDEPLTERDIADLRNVIAVAERGRMPDLAAKAQAMLDAGVLPARAAISVQASDEPMLAGFAELLRGLECGPASASWPPHVLFQLGQSIATQAKLGSSQATRRATADVERELTDANIHAVLDALPISYWDVPQDATVLFARAIIAATKGAKP